VSKFDRLLSIIDLIRSQPGIKATKLADETGVCRRTIYRDILNLGCHYPIVDDDGYRMLPTAFLKTLNLKPSEYNVFQLAISCPALMRPDLRPSFKSLKAKIDTVVDPRIRSPVRIDFQSCEYKAGSDCNPQKLHSICGTLEKAIENSLVVRLSSGEKNYGQQTVYPYALVHHPCQWHLVAYIPEERAFKARPLASISKISLIGKKYTRDDRFSLVEFLNSRWGMEGEGGEEVVVEVRFTGDAVRKILAYRHHPKETVTKLNDFEVLYSVIVQGTEEIAQWILGFGTDAEVIAPNTLRQDLARKIKGLLNLYLNTAQSEALK
jgi:predicted DNA-binding transcriptional regulator YafY